MMRVRALGPEQGFTLVELAIILVIVGILVSLGVGMMGPLVKTAKYTESKDTVNGAVQSVIGFATTSNRLPSTGEFPSVVRDPRDSWGNSLYYIPESSITASGNGGVCGRKTTTLSVKVCPDAACGAPTATIQDVTFVIISAGANFNIQTENAGGTVRVYAAGIGPVDDYTADMTRPEEYDDIVKWITLNELRTRAGCEGAPLKIVNNELPSGAVGTAYSAEVFADNGVPYPTGGKYRWCVEPGTPNGVNINPNRTSNNCAGLAEGSWGSSDTLVFSGKPKKSGSFSLTVFVRDNNDTTGSNDNVASKSLVMTVNP